MDERVEVVVPDVLADFGQPYPQICLKSKKRPESDEYPTAGRLAAVARDCRTGRPGRESRLHLRWGGMRMPIEQRLCREHPALQAVAALERLFRNEACCTGCGCSAVPRLLALSPGASPYTQGNLYEGL